MAEVIVIKVYTASPESKWVNLQDSDLRLIHYLELPLENNAPRSVQGLLASLARTINERRIK